MIVHTEETVGETGGEAVASYHPTYDTINLKDNSLDTVSCPVERCGSPMHHEGGHAIFEQEVGKAAWEAIASTFPKRDEDGNLNVTRMNAVSRMVTVSEGVAYVIEDYFGDNASSAGNHDSWFEAMGAIHSANQDISDADAAGDSELEMEAKARRSVAVHAAGHYVDEAAKIFDANFEGGSDGQPSFDLFVEAVKEFEHDENPGITVEEFKENLKKAAGRLVQSGQWDHVEVMEVPGMHNNPIHLLSLIEVAFQLATVGVLPQPIHAPPQIELPQMPIFISPSIEIEFIDGACIRYDPEFHIIFIVMNCNDGMEF